MGTAALHAANELQQLPPPQFRTALILVALNGRCMGRADTEV